MSEDLKDLNCLQLVDLAAEVLTLLVNKQDLSVVNLVDAKQALRFIKEIKLDLETGSF